MIAPEAREAYAGLVAPLRSFVARRVPASEVDDVVQDVFVRLQRGVGALRDEERFGPWVYRVARSAIAESQRARARHPLPREAPSEEHLAAEVPPADATDSDAPDARLAAAAAALVDLLPSPYREALVLTEIEGLTQKEAAERAGIGLSGMKSRVQRGRAQLRRWLDLCCEIALDARGHVIGCEPRARTPEAHAQALAALGGGDGED